jgi:hypothetical protein
VEWLFNLLFFGLVAWALWLVFQPRCAFVVRVRDGSPAAVKGTVTGAFLEQVREVCGRHAVQRATVRGLIREGRISLGFSRAIPPSGQQQLRNWWAHSGWRARPRRA